MNNITQKITLFSVPPRQNSQYIKYVAPEARKFLHIFFSGTQNFGTFVEKKPNIPKKTKPKILNQTPQEKTKKEPKEPNQKKRNQTLSEKTKFEEFGLKRTKLATLRQCTA